MIPPSSDTPTVTLYWRPGCGFCRSLRRELDRSGVAHTEVNIWEDPEAAALVRSLASGNETVPTVVVGDHGMVNPSARQVLATLADLQGTGPVRTPPSGTRQALVGIGWSVAAAAAWMVLALTHPSTTYHFAPLVTAVAWPVAASLAPGRAVQDNPGRLPTMGAAVLALAVLGVLAFADALRGPALIGSTAGEETLVMIAAGTLISVLFARRRATSNGQRSDSATTSTSSTGG